ncbi:hypothetical protein EDC04DRAFT_2910150 [Pisolithus marmoratus]|nr:hypothetical protein EDC04DRAFT_2910150 [Pisolithus marmoratus]
MTWGCLAAQVRKAATKCRPTQGYHHAERGKLEGKDTIHAERGELEGKGESGKKRQNADPHKDTIHAERSELERRAWLLNEAVERRMRQGSPPLLILRPPLPSSSLRGQAEREYRVDEAERTRDARSDFPNISRKAADEQGAIQEMSERMPTGTMTLSIQKEANQNVWYVLPSDAADKGRVDPDTERNTFQIERSNLGSRAHTGEVGEERKDVDPQNGSVHTERNEQEPDTFSLQGQAEREGVEVQNDSPHTEGDELELMVYPPGEAGVGQENSVTESYSPRTEAASRVFGQGEAREERDDAEPLGSSLQRERNGLELETGAIVMAREDTGPQSLPSEPEPNICVTRGTTEPPSVASQVSMLNHSVRMLEDNPSLVPPGANLEPHRTSLISKLAKLFRRQKSPQGTQEKRGASPKIVHAGQFNEPVVVTSWNADRQAPQPSEANQHQPVTPMDDGSRPSTRNRDDQSSMDPSKYRPTTAPTDTIDGQTNDDGEHDGDCCCFCFKLSPSKMTLKW